MKALFILLLAISHATVGLAQQVIETSTDKTVSLSFPSPVSLVDLGSSQIDTRLSRYIFVLPLPGSRLGMSSFGAKTSCGTKSGLYVMKRLASMQLHTMMPGWWRQSFRYFKEQDHAAGKNEFPRYQQPNHAGLDGIWIYQVFACAK